MRETFQPREERPGLSPVLRDLIAQVLGTGAAADNLQGQVLKSLTDTWDLKNTGTTTTFAATFSETVATPEPATWMLMMTGMLGVIGGTKLRKRRS